MSLRNDCFALPAGVNWIPVDEAHDYLRKALTTVAAKEVVDIMACAGRVLAKPVHARHAHPPYANSAVDGYGLAGIDTAGDVPLVLGRAAAGVAFDGIVPAGHAVRILTGARVPEGVDRIVLQEDVTAKDDSVHLSGTVKTGANIRQAGEDITDNAEIFASGHRLAARDLAVLASVGIDRVDVYQHLRVGIASTGDELRPPGQATNGTIPDANRPMLLAQMRAWGIEAVDLGVIADSADAAREMLDHGAATVDAIITTGGASAGDEDHMARLLGVEGHRAIWRVAIKPGRPLALGVWQGVPVFALPGNPVAAFVCACLFARPALGVLAGEGWHLPTPLRIPAAFHKHKKAGRREYLRARLDKNGHAEIFTSEGSGRVSGLSWSDGLVMLPDEAATIEAGSMIDYIPYSAFASRR